ncbi:MAG: hypothetical protein R3E93_12340 [Thiothrix sp.]
MNRTLPPGTCLGAVTRPLAAGGIQPQTRARKLYSAIRADLGLNNSQWQAGAFAQLSRDTREDLRDELEREIAGAPFFNVA